MEDYDLINGQCKNCRTTQEIKTINNIKYCSKCNSKDIITLKEWHIEREKQFEQDRNNSDDSNVSKLYSTSYGVGVSPHAVAQRVKTATSIKPWRSGWKWSAYESVRKRVYENKFNKESKFNIYDLYRLATSCDKYIKELSIHIIETLGQQMNMEMKTRKDITGWRARKSPKYRIGKYTYYLVDQKHTKILTPLKQKNGELRDIAI